MNDNEITPPDDVVNTVDLGNGLTLTDFRSEFRKKPADVRAMLPDGSTFWETPVYMVYSATMPSTLIAGTEAQAQELEAINSALESIGIPRIAVWAPSTAREYVGDLELTTAQTAKLIAKVHLLATTARALGRQDITESRDNLQALSGTVAASVLHLILAREAYGKSLMLCDQAELERVHGMAGTMLMAMMVAKGSPIAKANLPALPGMATAADQAAEPPAGQGQWPGYL